MTVYCILLINRGVYGQNMRECIFGNYPTLPSGQGQDDIYGFPMAFPAFWLSGGRLVLVMGLFLFFFYTYSFWYLILNWETLSVPT